MYESIQGMNDRELITFHSKLLNARERMQCYRQAILAAVRPGDTVIDLGCGSGILGLFACQAGAKRVYAIERSSAITVAKELAKANNFADRIVHLKQDIKDVHLDEQADIIVSELISKGVLGQKMAESIGYCRDNFLKPGGRILPEDVSLFVAPADCAAIYQKTQLPDPETYGLDFSPVAARSCNIPLSAHIPAEALLASGQAAYHYNALNSPGTDHFDATLSFEVQQTGVMHGFCLWFSSVLADGVVLSNAPPGIGAWDNLFLPLTTPVQVQPGMAVELALTGRDDSHMPFTWLWETTIRNGSHIMTNYRQSTFFANLLSK